MFLAKCLVVVAVMGGAWSAPMADVSFADEVHDFLHLIPTEKILGVVTDYLAYDKEVQNFVAYTQTEQFRALVRAVDSQPEYIKFLNLLEEGGFDAYKYVNVIHTLLGMPGLDNPYKDRVSIPKMSGGVKGMIRDIRALVDVKSVTDFYDGIVEANPQFQALVEKFKGGDFKILLEKLATIPELTELVEKLGSGQME